MSKCSSCRNDFVPLLKSNGLLNKTCDKCRCDDKKYKDTHREQTKFMIFNIVKSIKIKSKKKQKNILKQIRIKYTQKEVKESHANVAKVDNRFGYEKWLQGGVYDSSSLMK